jgi:hypothetical protein
MPSAINENLPLSGNPTTASVRGNFAAAKNEIETLQNQTTSLTSAVNALGNIPPYFSNEAVTAVRNNIQAFAAATPADALFPVLLNGTNNSLDGAGNQLRAPTDGFYIVQWVILPRGDTATATVTPTLRINGVDIHAFPNISATTTLAIPQYITLLRRFTAGDVITLRLSFSVVGGLKSRNAGSWNDDNRAQLVRVSAV